MRASSNLCELDLELRAASPTPEDLEAGLCADDRVRIRALRAANAQFLAGRDVDAFVRRLDAHAHGPRGEESQPRGRWGWGSTRWAWALPALAVAWIGGAVSLRDPPGALLGDGPRAVSPGLRAKGGAALGLRMTRVAAGGALLPLSAGETVRPGEVLQLHVEGPSAGAGLVIFSIDGRGETTLHFPHGPTDVLGAGGALPRSFELDDAPAYERFFLISGSQLDVEAILARARALAGRGDAASIPFDFSAEMGVGMAQSTYLLRKEVP